MPTIHALPGSRGFTLIELICAVAIMLLLASLLLAMTSSIRHQAGRLRCAATERQVYEGLVIFSMDNNGQVPLVYNRGCRQDNYYFYNADNRGAGSDTAGALGVLFDRGYIDPQRGWFCAANRNPKWSFKTAENPWPPRRGVKTRGNYGVRPEKVEWATRLPRLSDFANKAIITDIISESVQLLDHHKTGTNVTYGDGSVRYQLFAKFSAPYRFIPNGSGYGAVYNNAFMQVWRLLDGN